MTRANDANDSDEPTTNDETPQIGRVCDHCGDYYFVVTVTGPERGDARRGCGCPVTVVSSGPALDEADAETEDGEVVA